MNYMISFGIGAIALLYLGIICGCLRHAEW